MNPLIQNNESAHNNTNVVNPDVISRRIVQNAQLLLMTETPEVNENLHNATILTPRGLFQWNQEINVFTCIAHKDEFNLIFSEELVNIIQSADIVDKASLYPRLTLDQLNHIECMLQRKGGYSIIGYSINEEMFIRIINLLIKFIFRGKTEYPPLPEDYSRLLLSHIKTSIVSDIASSFRLTAQSFLMFNYFSFMYFEYEARSDDDYLQFSERNQHWFLTAIAALTTLTLFLLRSGFVEKTSLLAWILRARFIEEQIIAYISNLINYGLTFFSLQVVNNAMISVMIVGIITGYFKKYATIVNMSQLTHLKFFLRILLHSLTVGSFVSLGFSGFFNSVFFLYTPDSPSVTEKFSNDLEIAHYVGFSLMFFLSLFRHPYLSADYLYFGRYACNAMNGIGIMLLDNYALYLFINLSFQVFFPEDFHPQQPAAPTFYCFLNILSFLLVFCASFPTTNNLPIYSLEKNPIKPTNLTKAYNLVNSIVSFFCPQKKNERTISGIGAGVKLTGEEKISVQV